MLFQVNHTPRHKLADFLQKFRFFGHFSKKNKVLCIGVCITFENSATYGIFEVQKSSTPLFLVPPQLKKLYTPPPKSGHISSPPCRKKAQNRVFQLNYF